MTVFSQVWVRRRGRMIQLKVKPLTQLIRLQSWKTCSLFFQVLSGKDHYFHSWAKARAMAWCVRITHFAPKSFNSWWNFPHPLVCQLSLWDPNTPRGSRPSPTYVSIDEIIITLTSSFLLTRRTFSWFHWISLSSHGTLVAQWHSWSIPSRVDRATSWNIKNRQKAPLEERASLWVAATLEFRRVLSTRPFSHGSWLLSSFVVHLWTSLLVYVQGFFKPFQCTSLSLSF